MKVNRNFTRKSKFNAKKTTYKGTSYPSKFEASVAEKLDWLVSQGAIRFWLRQVPFHIWGDQMEKPITHRVDFMVVSKDDYVYFLEAKGRDLEGGKLRREWIQKEFDVPIAVVTAKDVRKLKEDVAQWMNLISSQAQAAQCMPVKS